jgi:hypothetical protein
MSATENPRFRLLAAATVAAIGAGDRRGEGVPAANSSDQRRRVIRMDRRCGLAARVACFYRRESQGNSRSESRVRFRSGSVGADPDMGVQLSPKLFGGKNKLLLVLRLRLYLVPKLFFPKNVTLNI